MSILPLYQLHPFLECGKKNSTSKKVWQFRTSNWLGNISCPVYILCGSLLIRHIYNCRQTRPNAPMSSAQATHCPQHTTFSAAWLCEGKSVFDRQPRKRQAPLAFSLCHITVLGTVSCEILCLQLSWGPKIQLCRFGFEHKAFLLKGWHRHFPG